MTEKSEQITNEETREYLQSMYNYATSNNENAVNSSSLALKSLLIINGGAAIAMLSFIANIFDSNKLTQNDAVIQLSEPLIWFGWGLILAFSAMVFAYWTNYSVTEYTFRIITNGYGCPKKLKQKNIAHIVGALFTIALPFFSLSACIKFDNR